MIDVELLWSHPLTKRLQQYGFTLTEDFIAKQDRENVITGLRFYTETTEIVYSFDDVKTVRIVLYRRLQQRAGMTNSFRDFIWFLECAEVGLIGVTGVVRPTDGVDTDVLAPRKIVRMYEHLTAKVIKEELGGLVVYGELPNLMKIWKKWPTPPRPGKPIYGPMPVPEEKRRRPTS